LTAYKYREGTGHLSGEDTPFYIWFPWTVGFLGLTGFYVYLRFKPGHTVKYPGFGEEVKPVKETLAVTVAREVLLRRSPRKLSPRKEEKLKSN